MDISIFIDQVYLVVCTFPAIAGIVCYRHLGKAAKILAYYYLLVVLVEFFLRFLPKLGYTNTWVYHFFDPVEYLFIALAFSYWMKNKKVAKILKFSIPVFWTISLANSLRMSDIFHYSYAALSVAYLVYVFVSSYAIYKIITYENEIITLNPVFWLAGSLLIMSANNELWYALHDLWVTSQKYLLIFNLHKVFNLISFVLSSAGLILYRYHKKVEKTSEVSIYWN